MGVDVVTVTVSGDHHLEAFQLFAFRPEAQGDFMSGGRRDVLANRKGLDEVVVLSAIGFVEQPLGVLKFCGGAGWGTVHAGDKFLFPMHRPSCCARQVLVPESLFFSRMNSINRSISSGKIIRGEEVPHGYYHLVVHIWIRNSKGEYLISQRSADRPTCPLMWECVGGSVIKGEDSLTGALRETREEVGKI